MQIFWPPFTTLLLNYTIKWNTYTYVCMCVYIYIYIYTHIYNENIHITAICQTSRSQEGRRMEGQRLLFISGLWSVQSKWQRGFYKLWLYLPEWVLVCFRFCVFASSRMDDLKVALKSSFSFQSYNPLVVCPQILSALPVKCIQS